MDLAKDGDALLHDAPEQAVHSYQLALQQDEQHHQIVYRLALAYEHQREWRAMRHQLERATSLAPEVTDYWFKLGVALVRLNDHRKATQPLETCVAQQPAHAECHFYLGEVLRARGDEQAALNSYTRAILSDPSQPEYYLSLADLYLNLKLAEQAQQVLAAGLVSLEPTTETRSALYSMHLLLANSAQMKSDPRGFIEALQGAQGVAGDDHPELDFNLGAAYVTLVPPDRERGKPLLLRFHNRACQAPHYKRFANECQITRSLLLQLDPTWQPDPH